MMIFYFLNITQANIDSDKLNQIMASSKPTILLTKANSDFGKYGGQLKEHELAVKEVIERVTNIHIYKHINNPVEFNKSSHVLRRDLL